MLRRHPFQMETELSANPITLEQLYRFPVKGLSAEPLEAVDLTAGEGMPGDRMFGFARYNSGFDPENPRPLPKENFVVLLNEAALAGLQTSFDAATQSLAIAAGAQTRRFDMRDKLERDEAASFLSRVLNLSDAQPPQFVSSEPHRFTDVSVISPAMMNAISVLNLASVRAFEKQTGAKVHPGRFRANMVIDGLPPFFELDAVGSFLMIGDLQFRIISRTKRCAATEVNPETADRDLKVPYLLRKHLGHMDMGVYVEVVAGGHLSKGDAGQMVHISE
jgi:uncharacterized protein YcbX